MAGLDKARRTNAGPRGTPERHAAGHNQGTRAGAKQQRLPGAANPGTAHNTQPTIAREQGPGNSQPTNNTDPSQQWRGKSEARTQTNTPQHPSQEWRGTAKTRAQTHTSTLHTPASSGVVQAERAHQHTHTPTPQPGVAGRSRNPSPSIHTHAAHPSQACQGTRGACTRTRTPQGPSQEWRGAPETRAETHKPTPHTPARSGRVQPKPEPKHTNPHCTPQPGVAGYKGSTHTSTHTPQHPSQEPRGAAKTRTLTQTPTPHTPARCGRVEEERAHQHRHIPTPQSGVAGRS